MFYKASKDQGQFTYIPNEDLLLDGKLRLASENAENKNEMPKEVKDNSDGRPV